ncbi:MAG: GNAT family N-acyltransferase [Bacteroidota bacterium]
MNLIETGDIIKAARLNRLVGPGLEKLVMHLIGLNKLNKLYSSNSDKEGLEFIDGMLEGLQVKFDVSDEDIERIPRLGPFIAVSNHPFGGIDGLILMRLLLKSRPDIKIFANFLLQKVDPLKDFILPLNPFEGLNKSSLIGIKNAANHLANKHPLGVFPAGEVSSYYHQSRGVTDKQWSTSMLKFIKKSNVPVVPVYFKGSNTFIFHLLGLIHPKLRTARLPVEIWKQKNKTLQVRIGRPITVEEQSQFPDISRYGRFLRAKTYALGSRREVNKFFKPLHIRLKKPKEIVAGVDSLLIKKEVEIVKRDFLLIKHDQFNVICAPSDKLPVIMNEIGRLREITFREIGEGTNREIDLDEYDLYYHQLFIWDEVNEKIIGAYRVGMGKEIIQEYGIKGFYIRSLFKIDKKLKFFLSNSIELGRSFIIKEYQKKPLPLFLLWKGITLFLLKNPESRYLIGPVSISSMFSKFSRKLIIDFVKSKYFNEELAKYIKPKKAFMVKNQFVDTEILVEKAMDFNTLNKTLKDYDPEYFGIPVLLKKYLNIGGKIIGFNLDPKFNNALDGLLVLDVFDIPGDIIVALSREVEDKSILARFFEDKKGYDYSRVFSKVI